MRIAFVSQPRDAIAATGGQRGSVAIVTWELARRLANAAALAEEAPDVVHIQTCAQFIPAIRRAVPRARIVLHAHDELLTRLDRATVEKRLADADAVVTCSDYVTRRWRARVPSRAADIHTIGNGVDLERFQPAAASDQSSAVEPSILYVGRVSREKACTFSLKLSIGYWPGCPARGSP